MTPPLKSLGPWASSLNNNSRLGLSTFWRRRMHAIAALPLAPRRCGRRAFGSLMLGVMLLTAAPLVEFQPARAVAQQRQSAEQAHGLAGPTLFELSSRAAPPTDAEREGMNAQYRRANELQKQLAESHGYRLGPGELLKFVPAEKGGEVRRELAKLMAGDRTVMLSFQDKDGELRHISARFDKMNLQDVLDLVFRVKLHRIACEPALLAIPLEGDWIFANDPRAWRLEDAKKFQVDRELVEAFQATLRDALPSPLRFDLRTIDRPSLVARGDYRFTGIPVEEGTTRRGFGPVGETADGPFEFPAQRDQTSATLGSFPELLEDVGELLLTPIVDEIAGPPQKRDFFWQFDDKVHVEGQTPLDAVDADKVIAALAKQTGLTISRENRPVQILAIMPAEEQSGASPAQPTENSR